MERRWVRVYARSQRVLAIGFGVIMGAALLLAIADHVFAIRERAYRQASYQPVAGGEDEYERARRSILYHIALLQQPRHGKHNIGGDPSARLIEAALLYGRLALLEEARGNTAARNRHMADGIALLRAARHPSPTEEHIRAVVAKQDANRRVN